MIDLNTIWFILIGVLFTGYAILDGFDLGVGVLHLFARDNKERRINMNAIGPVWDGNEVWLLTGAGALFAAFPPVYATVLSGFYLALMLVLAALIFRAVSLEFRGQVDSPGWRRLWDWSFGLGSLLPAVLFGVAVGNILRGIPIDGNGMFAGGILGLLNPYSILIGVLSLFMLVMHGALYMTLKTAGPLQARMGKWASGAWIGFVVLYLLATVSTAFVSPFIFEGIIKNPLFWVLSVLMAAAVIHIPLALKAAKYMRAFLSSSVTIACIIGLAAVGMFPKIVPSVIDLEYSLTVYNSSATPRSLTAMLVIALIGMPVVIAYTVYVYRVFKGKVQVTDEGY